MNRPFIRFVLCLAMGWLATDLIRLGSDREVLAVFLLALVGVLGVAIGQTFHPEPRKDGTP